jgi:hypothetical protein
MRHLQYDRPVALKKRQGEPCVFAECTARKDSVDRTARPWRGFQIWTRWWFDCGFVVRVFLTRFLHPSRDFPYESLPLLHGRSCVLAVTGVHVHPCNEASG